MKAVTKILAGSVAAAALFSAAPAAAQYYPGNPGYGYGNPVGQVLSQVLGGGAYGNNGYGYNNGYSGYGYENSGWRQAFQNGYSRGYRDGYNRYRRNNRSGFTIRLPF